MLTIHAGKMVKIQENTELNKNGGSSSIITTPDKYNISFNPNPNRLSLACLTLN